MPENQEKPDLFQKLQQAENPEQLVGLLNFAFNSGEIFRLGQNAEAILGLVTRHVDSDNILLQTRARDAAYEISETIARKNPVSGARHIDLGDILSRNALNL